MTAKFGGVTRLNSGSFRARFTYRGNSYSKTFPRQSAVHAWLEQERRLIAVDRWIRPHERERHKRRSQITVVDFVVDLSARRKWARSTRELNEGMFRRDIEPVLRNRPLVAVAREEVRAWYKGTSVYPIRSGSAQ